MVHMFSTNTEINIITFTKEGQGFSLNLWWIVRSIVGVFRNGKR